MSDKKKKICFFAKTPNNILMFWRLYQVLVQDSRITLYLCGMRTPNNKPRLLFQSFDMHSTPLLSLPLVKWRRFDMMISPHMTLVTPHADWRIQIYNSASFQGRYFGPLILKFNKLFTIGEEMRRRYIKQGILIPNDERLESVGMPRTDPLVKKSFDREVLIQKLNLDPSQPTILYAPTWRKESSIYTFGRELISYLRQAPFNVLIKLHDWLYDRKKNPIDWQAELNLVKREGLVVIEDVDIIPYLYLTDVLISDISPLVNEFLLLNRPLIHLDVPYLFEKYKDMDDQKNWCRKTGPVVTDVREAMKEIEKAIEDPTHLSETRQKAAQDCFYHQGNATQIALQKIYHLLELPAPAEIEERINSIPSILPNSVLHNPAN